MIIYLDASAAAKLVWEETESAELIGYLGGFDKIPDAIRSGQLLETELRRAAARNQTSQRRVTVALDGIDLADMGREVFGAAGLLPGSHLRSLDALHIALALRMDADAFVTYDRRQADAADSCGLRVVSPGADD